MNLKRILCFILACCLLPPALSACGTPEGTPAEKAKEETYTPPSAVYAAPDGDPLDVTCKGSYLGQPDAKQVLARCGSGQLTQEVLQVFYGLEVLKFFGSGSRELPDPSLPFSQQPCPVDSSVNTWQQFFLRKALDSWYTAQALSAAAAVHGLPTESAFQPNLDNYAEYIDGMPAAKYLYRYEHSYTPNSMHQAFLDDLGALFQALAGKNGFSSAQELAAQGLHTSQEALTEAARLYNFGYMYLTTMEDSLLPTDEELDAYYIANKDRFPVSGQYADIRHILLRPGFDAPEAGWEACQAEARQMLQKWAKAYRSGEGSFAQLAHDQSIDTASAMQGGLYWHVAQGSLLPQLDAWVFDPQRQAGDTVIIRTELGIHTLYYAGGGSKSSSAAQDALIREKLENFVNECRAEFPFTVSYSDIVLSEDPDPRLRLSYSDILYPDIAHERFPEVPLYLQQDYGNTKYGNYPLRTYGCGITSLAMLSSYMTDTELTPPIMCARYGSYCSNWGTDYTIFRSEPPAMGYYLREQVFNPSEAYEALQQGYIVISCQQKGYWTKTGHYIVLEKMDEKGVQVRDSNIFNYKRIPAHKEDRHSWDSITPASASYWIFEKKPVRSELCSRCGNPEKYTNTILSTSYLCKRCSAALVRRNCYLEL